MPVQLRFKGGGVGQYFEGEGWTGKLTEVHVSTCSHCQHQTEYPSQKRMLEFVDICRGCMRLICLECCGKPCRPFEQEAERQELEARIQRKVHMGMWRCY